MKRRITLAVLVFLLSLQAFSQSPNWMWAKSAGDSASDIGNSIAADASGNVYVTGNFLSDSIHFGSTVLYNAAPDSITYKNVFIAKYDSAGNVLWAKGAGGTFDDIAESITTDNDGNVYVTGALNNDSVTFGSTILDNAGMFVVKYDSSGSVLWAKCSDAVQSKGHGITTDATGNVYVTGNFHSPSITFGSIALTCSGNSRIFIVKYDSSGNVLWAKCAGGNYNTRGNRITTDLIGNVFVTGTFGGPSVTFGSTVLTWAGGEDVFLAKYDSSGNVLWAQSEGGTCDDYVYGICTDSEGNVYVTGEFNSPSITPGSTVLTNAGGNCGNSCFTCMDMFIIKYDSSGNVLWAKSTGGTGNEWANCITADGTGNVCVTGFFNSPSVTFGNTVLSNGGMFVVNYDSSGNVPWAISTGVSQGSGITSDAAGNLYVTGHISGNSTLFGSTVLTNAGEEDVFTARLSSLAIGINEPIFADRNVIVIFPNPTNNSFTINNISTKENSMLQIINSSGKIVYTEKLCGKNAYVVDANYAKGIYFVRINDVVRKLIIK